MKIFTCGACKTPVFFSNLNCTCGAPLFYDPDMDVMLNEAQPCQNRQPISCNWKAEGDTGFCRSCQMTQTIPDTFHGDNVALWRVSEQSKRWVLSNLMRWGWFTAKDNGPWPTFKMLAEQTSRGEMPVTMGHANGLITINVTEGDPVVREFRRDELDERLRTMTAHFRHEIAHFLFLRLQTQQGFTESFRALFGDESADYGAALDRHYQNGAPADFQSRFVTPYASSHPHEDWAETCAHVMHLTDIVDSASAAELRHNRRPRSGYDAYKEAKSEKLLDQAFKFGTGLNHIVRSMGMQDIYPFVISPNVKEKLIFAHRHLMTGARKA